MIYKMNFYKSYFETAKKLPTDEERLVFYDAIFNYMFENATRPEGLPFSVDLVFTTIESFLNAELDRKNGGAPEGNTNAAKGETCRKCSHYKQCYRKGDAGVICELFELSPKTTQNNVPKQPKTNNVNVNDKDNVKENVYVNDGSATSHNHFLNINNLSIREGLNLKPFQAQNINNFLVANNLDINYLNYCLDAIKSQYQGKTKREINSLFLSGVTSWDSLLKGYKNTLDNKSEEKKKKKPLPPKVCTFCGAALVPGGFVGSVVCPTCKDINGGRVFWELIGNEWKVSRQ